MIISNQGNDQQVRHLLQEVTLFRNSLKKWLNNKELFYDKNLIKVNMKLFQQKNIFQNLKNIAKICKKKQLFQKKKIKKIRLKMYKIQTNK